jgi:large subunit ribosomal protein L22
MITASLKNFRISPRKVRVVADLIRGKNAILAGQILVNADKKAKGPLNDLLSSAIANAKNNFNIEPEKLIVKEIRVDQGLVMKRFMPVSRGSAHPIKKKTSHISIVLAPAESKAKKASKPAAKSTKKIKK